MSTMNMKRFRAKIDIQHILMMMLVFILSFSIAIPISTITVHADGTSDFAGTSGGGKQASSGSGHPYYARTGWLVYICRESTGTLLSNVVYVNSTNSINTRGLKLNTDYLLSRVGGQVPTQGIQAQNGCPWGTPWTDSGATRYKEVEKYFIDNGKLSAKAKEKLINLCNFPSNVVEQIVTDDDVCLILENCAYYRLERQYVLASSYGFGKLYNDTATANWKNDTNGATEKFYGLGSVQKCEHFDKDHGNLPSHVTVTGSAWTPIPAANAANQSQGWGLSSRVKNNRCLL